MTRNPPDRAPRPSARGPSGDRPSAPLRRGHLADTHWRFERACGPCRIHLPARPHSRRRGPPPGDRFNSTTATPPRSQRQPAPGNGREALARAQPRSEHRQLHRSERDQRAAASRHREVSEREADNAGPQRGHSQPVGPRCSRQGGAGAGLEPHHQRQHECAREQPQAAEAGGVDAHRLLQRVPAQPRVRREGEQRGHGERDRSQRRRRRRDFRGRDGASRRSAFTGTCRHFPPPRCAVLRTQRRVSSAQPSPHSPVEASRQRRMI